MKLLRSSFNSRILVLLMALVISLLFTTTLVKAEDSTTGETVTENESVNGGLLSESVEVYITVSDITDYTNPMNVLVPRRKLTVTEFDMTPYGATLENINTIDGVTYMHALVQLHLELYGEDISEKLLLSDDGVTRYFMGRQTANVMYKNGNDIFELPQNVSIEDGDEIQVCLYNSSYSQGIATFSNACYSGLMGQAVNISLFEHFDSPRNRQALSGAEIVNQNGLYYTDSGGNIITTEADGSFDITFDEPGTYVISAMPQINYYMEPGDGTYKTVYDKVTTITPIQEEERWLVGKQPTTFTSEACKAFSTIHEDMVSGDVDFCILFWWEDNVAEGVDEDFCTSWYWDETTQDYVISGYEPLYETRYSVTYKEETTLVERKELATDEMLPAVGYTLPFCVVNVEGIFSADAPSVWFSSGSDTHDTFTTKLHYSTLLSENAVVWAASYDSDGRMLECQKQSIYGLDEATFTFEKGAAVYKLFFWDGETQMVPVIEALSSEITQ